MQSKELRRTKGTSSKSVYDSIRDRILSLELGPGELLDETTLAERYNVSRSPIREALIRLAGDELVFTLPNRSTIVAPLAMESFPKYVEALDVACRMNCRLAAELRTDQDIEVLESRRRNFTDAVVAKDHLAMTGANASFHMAIAQAGRNPYMTSFYGRLLDLGRRILHMHFRYLERRDEGVLLTREHDSIVSAIRDKNVVKVVELAHEHTGHFRDNVMSLMQERYLTNEPA